MHVTVHIIHTHLRGISNLRRDFVASLSGAHRVGIEEGGDCRLAGVERRLHHTVGQQRCEGDRVKL